ncbi:MAG: Bax inhibitor-1/YccA family protein [Ignavibacteria bacterium]|nr:Bax inhibitor-1/YccA family protein [Ignavibacteria bacterium]
MDNYNQYAVPQSVSTSTTDVRRFMLSVYNWMTLGLGITAFVSFGVYRVEGLMKILYSNPMLIWGLFILQIITVLVISAGINKIPSIVAVGLFFFYSFLTGITFSVLFMVYTSTSIAFTFFTCAAMFASVSVFGYITKMDMTRFGGYLFMALIGLIIASVVNIFLESTMIYWLTSYAGVVIFVGLTAYDTQMIKKTGMFVDSESETGKKAAVMGALRLYLDFINLFLYLLRFMGNRK